MENEIWKDIAGWEGLYQVSNCGRVRSVKRTVWDNRGYYKNVPEKILKAGKTKNGYMLVVLIKDGVGKSHKVHQLVAKAFIPNPSNLPIINHKNEIKSDNRVENIEWCSYSYNNSYNGKAKKIGEKLKGKKQSKESVRKRAEKLRGRKQSKETVRKKAEKKSKPIMGVHKVSGKKVFFPSIYESSRQTGISQGNICLCCQGKRKSTGGYIWKYADKEELNEK